MDLDGINIRDIQSLIIKNRCIMPNAKAKLGIILFKAENDMALGEDEEFLLKEIIKFIEVTPRKKKEEIS